MRESTELYSEEDREKLSKKMNRWALIMLLTALATLTACIVMCICTNTANAAAMERSAIWCSIIGGWIVIYGMTNIVTGAYRERAHAQMLADEPRERVEGEITVTKQWVRLPKSLTFFEVKVKMRPDQIPKREPTPQEDALRQNALQEDPAIANLPRVKTYHVAESRAERLKKSDICALYVTHGYVAAYEVGK